MDARELAVALSQLSTEVNDPEQRRRLRELSREAIVLSRGNGERPKSRRYVRPKDFKIDGLLLGMKLRDRGMALADNNASPWWKDAADDAIEETCRRLYFWTHDDVWDLFDEWEVPHPNQLGFDARAYGPRVRVAQGKELMVWTGRMVLSRRPLLQATDIKVFRSLIFDD